MWAAIQSNGVWFLQTIFVFSAFQSIMSGKYGVALTIAAVSMYTAFTMLGSLFAHYRALKNEAGIKAVGANKKYAQIPTEEWDAIKQLLLPAPPSGMAYGLDTHYLKRV